MALRLWSLEQSELRALAREGLLLLAVRCAMRVEPWRAPGLARDWRAGLAQVVASASSTPLDPSATRALARRIQEAGAIACNRLDGTAREALGRCHSYASSALAMSLEASALEGRPLAGALIYVAKLANSIPAVLAHAGRIRAPHGKSAVDHAAAIAWDATRRDVAALAAGAGERILRAPRWPARAPAWTRGP